MRSWLLTQSHARAVETIRSLTARRQREINDAHKAARGAYDMQHEAWDVVLAEDVKKALGELPPEERRAIELAYFEGYTYIKVAEILKDVYKRQVYKGFEGTEDFAREIGMLVKTTAPKLRG